jgi:hypothetical protein
MRNASFDTSHVKHCCEHKLRVTFKGGKEFNGWVIINNKKFARITVPMGKKFIPPMTYKSMATQLKITTQQFDNLLECPLGWEQYNEIAKKGMTPR